MVNYYVNKKVATSKGLPSMHHRRKGLVNQTESGEDRQFINVRIYFSDFFEVDPEIIEQYGALNISLINDLPLFIDPFLLFTSEKPEYKTLHNDIIQYVRFLKDRALQSGISSGLIASWYRFPEVKQ